MQSVYQGHANKDTPLERINLLTAGIDIGSTSHYIAVSSHLDAENVREFEAFTPDLQAACEWLKSLGVKSVAMESTGVYWIPFYEILAAAGFEVLLVNARHIKNVRRRVLLQHRQHSLRDHDEAFEVEAHHIAHRIGRQL